MFAPEVLGPTVDRLAELACGGRALEFAIGTGRVAVPLAERGVPVSGVELSQPMLDRLRTKADDAAIPVVLGDMATARVPGEFQLVYLVYNTIANLLKQAEQVACFRNAARHLAPGGRFVLDALWLAPGEAAAVARDGGRVREHTASVDGDRVQVVERWERAPGADRCCLAHYEYRRAGCRPVTADFEAHDWSASELFGRLRRAGLRVTELWGSYQRTPWSPGDSPQLIVEAALR